MNVEAFAYHPTVSKVAQLLEKTVGRDKLLRTIQYISRFLASYFAKYGISKEWIPLLLNIQGQLSLARKLFRAGKPISTYQTAAKTYLKKSEDPVIRFFSTVKHICMGTYLSYDTLIWLDKSRIYPAKDSKHVSNMASKFWLAGLVSSIVVSLRKYQGVHEKETALQREAEKDTQSLARVQAAKKEVLRQLLWDVLDCSIPLSSLQYANIDPVFVGLAGSITSILGLQNAWRSCK